MTEHQKQIALTSYHRRVKRFKAQGLNSRGRPYQRQPNLPRSKRAAHYRRTCLANFRRRQARFAAKGLNSRGQSYARADFTAGSRLRLMLQNFHHHRNRERAVWKLTAGLHRKVRPLR